MDDLSYGEAWNKFDLIQCDQIQRWCCKALVHLPKVIFAQNFCFCILNNIMLQEFVLNHRQSLQTIRSNNNCLYVFFGNVRLMQPSTEHPLQTDQMICVQKHTDKIRQILCFQHMATSLSWSRSLGGSDGFLMHIWQMFLDMSLFERLWRHTMVMRSPVKVPEIRLWQIDMVYPYPLVETCAACSFWINRAHLNVQHGRSRASSAKLVKVWVCWPTSQFVWMHFKVMECKVIGAI